MRLPKKKLKKTKLIAKLKDRLLSDEEVFLKPDTTPPGLRHQLKNIPPYVPPDGTMTAEYLEELIRDIWNQPREEEPRKVVIGRYCKTHGYIMDDGSVISNHCSDPECHNCNQFHELLAQEAKSFIKDNNNFINDESNNI